MQRFLIIVTVVALFAAGASAAVTTFTDRAAWEAAIGDSPDILVDFDGVTVDTSFVGTPFDAGPFSLVGSSDVYDFIDAAPFEGVEGEWAIDGTTYALSEVSLADADEFEMTFDTLVTAWGADFSKVDFGGLDLVLTSDVGTTTVSVPTIPATGFFGFVTSPPESISSITFVARSEGEAFGMDNVALFPGTPIPTVSEWGLAVMTLLVLTAGTLVFARRRMAST